MTPERLGSLDALRGVAAISVLVFHYEALVYFVPPNGWPRPSTEWTHLGLMGVELFFVISGFVILLTLEKTPTLLRFAVNRIARLYPAYWLSVLFAGTYLLSTGEANLTTVAINLTMVQRLVRVPSLITPYWTLTYELMFYIGMAIACGVGLLNRIEILALAWFGFAFAAQYFGVHLTGVLHTISMIQFGHLFIAGMMVYRISSGRSNIATFACLILALGYSLFGRTDWAEIRPLPYFLINGLSILVVYLAVRDAVFLPLWLQRVGRYSYSLYLLHLIVGMIAVRVATHLNISPWIGIAIAVPVAFWSASLSNRFIELPGQLMLKNWLAPDTAGGRGRPRNAQ